MSDQKETTEEVEAAMLQALETARRDGKATVSVKDGQFFFFNREHLQKMLDAKPDAQELVIFVQQQTLH